jgi:starvation-inducible DNA-binding protein
LAANWDIALVTPVQQFEKREDSMTSIQQDVDRRTDREKSPSAAARHSMGESLRTLLADVFTLYLETKNFHWHMTGPHFRDYHLLLDEHADQLFAMSDVIAERA